MYYSAKSTDIRSKTGYKHHFCGRGASRVRENQQQVINKYPKKKESTSKEAHICEWAYLPLPFFFRWWAQRFPMSFVAGNGQKKKHGYKRQNNRTKRRVNDNGTRPTILPWHEQLYANLNKNFPKDINIYLISNFPFYSCLFVCCICRCCCVSVLLLFYFILYSFFSRDGVSHSLFSSSPIWTPYFRSFNSCPTMMILLPRRSHRPAAASQHLAALAPVFCRYHVRSFLTVSYFPCGFLRLISWKIFPAWFRTTNNV